MRLDGVSMDEARAVAQAAAALPHAVLLATVPATRTVMVAASPDSGVDAAAELRPALAAAGGKGGGSARFAQGSVPDPAALEPIVARLLGSHSSPGC